MSDTIRREHLEAWPEHQYMSLLLTSMYFMQGLDFLKTTRYHKQRLKNGVSIVHDELRSLIEKDLLAIMGKKDQEPMYLIADGIEELLKECLLMRPEFSLVVLEIVKKLREKPQEVLDFFQITLTEDAELC